MLHNRYLVPGGEDACVQSEVDLLRQAGHHVELLEESNHSIEELGRVSAAIRTFWSLSGYAKVRRTLQSNHFDVVHVHNFFPLFSPSVYYAANAECVPVVQTLHNYRLICPCALLYRDGGICERCVGHNFAWPAIANRCYRGSGMASAAVSGMLVLHKALRTWETKVQVFIALTEFARDKFVQAGLPKYKFAIKPNFVSSHESPAEERADYAIFVGRLSEEKGIRTLLEAWARIQSPLRLLVVGDGPLASLVREASAKTPQVEFLGLRSPLEVQQLLARAALMVFPSEWYEVMPRTIIEAFAAGTPVLATRLGAAAQMVQDGRNGAHFAPGDAADLAAKADSLMSNRSGLRQLGDNARCSFEDNYDATQNLNILTDIYARAVHERAAHSK